MLEAAERERGLFPFLGIHPWRADRLTPAVLSDLDERLGGSVAGVGEIGLDRAKIDVPWETQQTAFAAQLALAVRHRRPVNLHAVRATDALLSAFKSADAFGLPAIVHGFRGGPALAAQLCDAGFFLSFPPALLDPAQGALRDAFRATRMDRILLETDAPNRWGGLAEVLGLPAAPGPETLLPLLYHDAAALKRITPAELAERIEENAARIRTMAA